VLQNELLKHLTIYFLQRQPRKVR